MKICIDLTRKYYDLLTKIAEKEKRSRIQQATIFIEAAVEKEIKK